MKGAYWFEPYQWTRETISRFIPFFLIVYFNLRILFAYHASKSHRLSVLSQSCQAVIQQQKNEREERRLWLLLLAIMLTFVVCTLPAATLTIFVSDKKETNFGFQIIRSMSNILEFTKFALNFYLYCMINVNIRKLFVARILCKSSDIKVPMSRGSRNRPALAALVLMHTNPDRYLHSLNVNNQHSQNV